MSDAKVQPDAIPWAQPCFWGDEEKFVAEALRSSWISGGPFVNRLEEQFSRYCYGMYAAAVSNGTTALHMPYLALGIGPGEEVIVPGFAFMAAANVAIHVGAKPIFSEVDPDTWCMTARDIEPLITPRTKLIVPVHTYGNLCPMDEIVALGKSRGITVLEDAAESLGSKYNGKLCGTIGDVGTFSFQATKTITTGEGGLVVTRDKELHDRMLLYRSHGMLRKRYWHEVVGHNFRLTNLQAALGCAQFEHLEHIIDLRRNVHTYYHRRLGNVPGLAMQKFEKNVDVVLWAMAVKLDPRAYPQGRDAVMQQMHEKGIETRPGFYTPSQMPLYDSPPLPVCEDIAAHVISLPTFPTLSESQVNRVCDALLSLRR